MGVGIVWIGRNNLVVQWLFKEHLSHVTQVTFVRSDSLVGIRLPFGNDCSLGGIISHQRLTHLPLRCERRVRTWM